MSLLSLPFELSQLIATYILENIYPKHYRYRYHVKDTRSLSKLSRTNKVLAKVYQPMLFRSIYINQKSGVLLPLAYTLFTQRHLAQAVRSLQLHPAPLEDSSVIRRGWPAHAEHGCIRNQVALALDDRSAEDIDSCYEHALNCREDIVIMLIIGTTPNLDKLHLGEFALGPRDDDAYNRAIFHHAMPRLTKLSVVDFGKPYICGPSTERSYLLFNDLWQLPAIETIIARNVGPSYPEEIVDELSERFNFIREMSMQNSSLKKLVLSEMFAVNAMPLDHILRCCPALRCVEFADMECVGLVSETLLILFSDERIGYEDPKIWNVGHLVEKLETGTFQTLILDDALFYLDKAEEDTDFRYTINLSSLNLTQIYLDENWIIHPSTQLGETYMRKLGLGSPKIDEQRLVSMLPDSIQDLTIRTGNANVPCWANALLSPLRTLIGQHRDHGSFPELTYLTLEILSSEFVAWYEEGESSTKVSGVWKQYAAVLDVAKDAGLTTKAVVYRGRFNYSGSKENTREVFVDPNIKLRRSI